ncbi:S41 family peptidase [Paenibacillus pabuli]|uniref:S41 family peptidase n=1 Tax=Paenibacillus pabuli TaxID=1472 RepID=UPI003D7C8308
MERESVCDRRRDPSGKVQVREKHVKGIVIDLRDNPGGDDDLVARRAGRGIE